MIRDKLLIYNNLEDLNKKCKACYRRDHDIYLCPEVHYIPCKDFIIKRYLYSRPQLDQVKYIRTVRKKANAKDIFNSLQEKFLMSEAFILNQNKINNEENDEYFSESDLNIAKLGTSENIIKPMAFEEEKEEDAFKIKKNLDVRKNMENLDLKKNLELDILKKNGKNSKLNNFQQTTSINSNNGNIVMKCGSIVAIQKDVNWENEFERMHIFGNYFMKNNADLILKNYNNVISKKINRIIKLKRIKRKRTILASGISPGKSKSKFVGNIKENNDKSTLKMIHSPDKLSPFQIIENSIKFNFEDTVI